MFSFLRVRMARRKSWEVSDELWAVIEPPLPRHERYFRYPGRRRIDDRRTLHGILFVLYTGIQWEFLPQELGSAPVRRAGGAWPNGSRPAYGRSSSRCYWTACGQRIGWASPASPPMPRMCRSSGAKLPKSRPEPG